MHLAAENERTDLGEVLHTRKIVYITLSASFSAA